MRNILTADVKQVTIVHSTLRPANPYEQLRRQAHAAHGQNVSLLDRMLAEIERLNERITVLESRSFQMEANFDR